MKVSVCAQITYSYKVDLSEEASNDYIQAMSICDAEDPAYKDLCKVLSKYHLNFDGEIISIMDDETDEVIYMN